MKPTIILGVLSMALILAACISATPTASTLDVLSTNVAQTLQARASATDAPVSPTASLPPTETEAATATNTAEPSAANLPDAAAITFATGATQYVASGSVGAGGSRYFVAGAAEGQIMIVGLPLPDDDLSLSVFGADGTVLLDEAAGASSWRGALPSSQDYYFAIHSESEQDFTLNLIIAAPIEFGSGETEVSLSGRTADGYAVSYSAYALEGQNLELHLESDEGEVGLTIYGFSDGQPYARAQNGVTDFELTLPATQYYIIEVVPQGGLELDYELSIEIN